jgi:hypothetical protein
MRALASTVNNFDDGRTRMRIGVTPTDCTVILSQANEQIRLIHEALG